MKEQAPAPSAFELSRVYSQGWTTAKKLLASGTVEIGAAEAAERNPHATEEKRTRWTQGFMEALGTAPGAKRGQILWRAAHAKSQAG